jgi:hypothetical protein
VFLHNTESVNSLKAYWVRETNDNAHSLLKQAVDDMLTYRVPLREQPRVKEQRGEKLTIHVQLGNFFDTYLENPACLSEDGAMAQDRH